MQPTPDKITSATQEQKQLTSSLYNAACKIVSSLVVGDTQQLSTLAITRHVDHYTITWQRYNTAYHAAFVTAIATSHEGYVRQEWLDGAIVVYHSLEIVGWQSVTGKTELEERVERKSKHGKKRY